jgi:hypothetical protein
LSDGRLDKSAQIITKRINMLDVLEEGFKSLINEKDS